MTLGCDIPTLVDAKMQTTAEEYIRIKRDIDKQQEIVRIAQDEADRLRQHLGERHKDLRAMVGHKAAVWGGLRRGVSSRCIRLKTGEVMILRFRAGQKFDHSDDRVDIEIFGEDGNAIR